ncbi:MAG: hypothetical protein H7A33_02300 [Deltaproteobacteria bacterium]|nr:hypothetical protein [Deltaproteobacteria bacterium]
MPVTLLPTAYPHIMTVGVVAQALQDCPVGSDKQRREWHKRLYELAEIDESMAAIPLTASTKTEDARGRFHALRYELRAAGLPLWHQKKTYPNAKSIWESLWQILMGQSKSEDEIDDDVFPENWHPKEGDLSVTDLVFPDKFSYVPDLDIKPGLDYYSSLLGDCKDVEKIEKILREQALKNPLRFHMEAGVAFFLKIVEGLPTLQNTKILGAIISEGLKTRGFSRKGNVVVQSIGDGRAIPLILGLAEYDPKIFEKKQFDQLLDLIERFPYLERLFEIFKNHPRQLRYCLRACFDAQGRLIRPRFADQIRTSVLEGESPFLKNRMPNELKFSFLRRQFDTRAYAALRFFIGSSAMPLEPALAWKIEEEEIFLDDQKQSLDSLTGFVLFDFLVYLESSGQNGLIFEGLKRLDVMRKKVGIFATTFPKEVADFSPLLRNLRQTTLAPTPEEILP